MGRQSTRDVYKRQEFHTVIAVKGPEGLFPLRRRAIRERRSPAAQAGGRVEPSRIHTVVQRDYDLPVQRKDLVDIGLFQGGVQNFTYWAAGKLRTGLGGGTQLLQRISVVVQKLLQGMSQCLDLALSLPRTALIDEGKPDDTKVECRNQYQDSERQKGFAHS